MALRSVRYGKGVNVNTPAAPKDEYIFYVIPPLLPYQERCLENRLRSLGPEDMFKVIDYSGIVTGVIVSPVESGQDLPAPREVLSAIGGCAGHVVVSPLYPEQA